MKTLLLIAAGACLALPAAALAQPQPDRGVPDQHSTMPRPADQRPLDQRPMDQRTVGQRTVDQRTVDQRTVDQRTVGRPTDEGRHDMRRDERDRMDHRGFDDRRRFDDRRGGRWHHHRHQVCTIRHHHRVCFWR